MFGAKTIFRAKTFPPAWTTHNVLLGTQEMSCLEHKECPASNTRNVLLRTQGMSCFDHKECSVSNTRNFLLGTHGMFCFEHTECPSSNIRNFVRRTQGLSFLEHKECPASNTKNVLFEYNECPSSSKQHRSVIRVITLITLLICNTGRSIDRSIDDAKIDVRGFFFDLIFECVFGT